MAKHEEILEKKSASLGIREMFGKAWELNYKKFENNYKGIIFLKKLDDVSNSEIDCKNKT